LEVGPGLNLSKPRPVAPAPRISVEGIVSLLTREEVSLLRAEISAEDKGNPPSKEEQGE